MWCAVVEGYGSILTTWGSWTCAEISYMRAFLLMFLVALTKATSFYQSSLPFFQSIKALPVVKLILRENYLPIPFASEILVLLRCPHVGLLFLLKWAFALFASTLAWVPGGDFFSRVLCLKFEAGFSRELHKKIKKRKYLEHICRYCTAYKICAK